MMAVVIRGGIVAVPMSLLSTEELRADRLALSVENPARSSADRLGKAFAHHIPERLSSLVVDGGHVLYPLAAANVYRPRLRGKVVELTDERVKLPAKPTPYLGKLTAYQARAVAALAAVSTGCVVAACGAGKGEVVVALTGELGLTTLVLVSQIDQALELVNRLGARLGIPVGMVGGGERRIERATVAVVQALDPATVDELAPLFEVVIRDEVHHAAAEGELALWRRLRGRRWYGFTATPRTDGLQPFVHHFFGPVVAEISRRELVAAGRAVDPEIREVRTSFSAVYSGPPDWPRLLDEVGADQARNDLVVNTVITEGAGELSAVLTGRVEHAERLATQLRERGLRVEVMSSRRTKRDRTAILEAARRRELDVLVGTQLLDEGIDVTPLSRVFLVWPAKAEGRIVQRVGRALRPMPGKSSPVVFDFVDRRVGVLANQARKRRLVFAKHWPAATRAA